ncbi:MAG: hypothetical protein JWO35_669 [Candidatus Saccharibacteria bacterium]|nr:hypothetical protein [Candidatus Saccharibacteria bacterium]
MSEVSTDWWLSNPDALQSPKQEIGDYIEAQGFSVPKRFETLDEALDVVRAGGTIAVRSEHRDEYDGASGLMETFRIDLQSAEDSLRAFENYGPFDIDEQVYQSQFRSAVTAYRRGDMPGYSTMEDVVLGEALSAPTDLTLQRLQRLSRQSTSVRRYADLTNRSTAELMNGASFSFWEYVPGTNVTIVADSAIDDRYHVLGNKPKRKGIPSYYGWQISDESGKPIAGKENDSTLTPDVTQSLIKAYEAIRNLPRFASQHCPLLELQLDGDGKIWFLQYHRTRDFKAAGELLDPNDFSPAEGWHKADGVRGALDEPTTLKTAFWYPNEYGSVRHTGSPLPTIEDASTDWHWDWALSEIMARRRSVQLDYDSLERAYSTIAAAHGPRSRWFKPLAAVALDDRGLKKLVPKQLKEQVSHHVHRNNGLARVVIDFAVDGRNGYVRLDPDAEQPFIES